MTTVCRPADWSSSSGESKWGSEVASPTMVPTRFPPRAATSRCISDDEASAHPSSDSSKRYATSSLEPPTISNLAVFAACCRSARTNMATASMIATRIRARRLATGGDYETTGTNMRRSPKTQGIFCVAVFRHLLCLLPSFLSVERLIKLLITWVPTPTGSLLPTPRLLHVLPLDAGVH